MKKRILFLACSITCALSSTAQTTVWLEDFESGSPSTLEINNDGLTSSETEFNGADGAWVVQGEFPFLYANAAKFPPANQIAMSTSDYTTSGASDDYIMSPLTYIPANCRFRWDVRGLRSSAAFNPFNSYEVVVSTTGTDADDYTDVLFTETQAAFQTEHHFVDLSLYAGQTISIAIRNTSNNAYKLQIDNMEIIKLYNYDMEGVEVTTAIGVKQSVPVSIRGTFTNLGSVPVTGIFMAYRINGGAVVAEYVLMDIEPMETFDLVHPTPWTPTVLGVNEVEFWITVINGDNDMNTANDVAYKEITVYSDMTTKVPLYECMSSKECSPCKGWGDWIVPQLSDPEVFNVNKPDGPMNAVYYQMHFPGDPDPSTNDDAYSRWAYYGAAGIPENRVDGDTTMNQTIFDEDFNTPSTYSEYSLSEYPSFIELDVSASRSGNTISVDVNVEPLQDIPSSDLKVHIAVVEELYEAEAGFNGETEFHWVMRKMLPDALGTDIDPLTQYDGVDVSESFEFEIGDVIEGSSNLWEGMKNTQVIAWVQDHSTQHIYQSAMATDWIVGLDLQESVELLVYPNPTQDVLNIDFNQTLEENVSITLMDLNGRVIYQSTVSGMDKEMLNIGQFPDGVYVLNILGETVNTTQKVIKG